MDRITIIVLGLILLSFILGFIIGIKQRKMKPINFKINRINADMYTEKTGWNIITFFPEHPIEIKAGKECVLYLGIKE